MAEKKPNKMTDDELLKEIEKLKKESDALLVAAMRVESELEHDYITPEEEMKRYKEIFRKSQKLQEKKTELAAEALKRGYWKALELLEFCKPVK